MEQLPPFFKRIAVITGASGGIGIECANLLANAGATVILLARRMDHLITAREHILADGGQALAIQADIMNLNMLERAARRIQKDYGHIDILVHAANIMSLSLMAENDPEEWGYQAEKNLLGTFYTTHAFLPELLTKQGDMVTISSLNRGRNINEAISVYNSTRFGLLGWSNALRQEMAEQGLRVIVIEPEKSKKAEEETSETENTNLPVVHFPIDPEYTAQQIFKALLQPKQVQIAEQQSTQMVQQLFRYPQRGS